jgi:GNAT superfamily N-acetyltransferase
VSSSRYRVIEILDERTPEAVAAMDLIRASFSSRDRHSLDELRSEVEEKRRGLLSAYDYHLLAALDEGGTVAGAASGAYLEGVNAGFIMYLAVRPGDRGQGIAQQLRAALVEKLRTNAREYGYPDLNWVLGEVRSGSRWLGRLLKRGAIAFDFDYYHPGMAPAGDEQPFTLYREPILDRREKLPRELVKRILFSIYRRAYRVRYPLERPGFQAMLEQAKARSARKKPADPA